MKKILAAALLVLSGLSMTAAPVILTDTLSSGMPKGWKAYGMGGSCRAESGTLRVTAADPAREWGICKVFEISKPGKYTFSAEVSRPGNGTLGGNMQLLIIAGVKKGTCGFFGKAQTGSFMQVSSSIEIFDKTRNLTVYIHCPAGETGDFLIRNAQFSGITK